MKALVIAVLSFVSVNASADLLRPRPRLERPSNTNLRELADFRCYFDENENGRISKDEVLYYVDKETGAFVDVKKQRSYRIDSASVTKTPAGKPTQVDLSGTASVRLPGGGSVTIEVETDFMIRRRYNSVVTTRVRNLYRPSETPVMLDCSL